MSINRLWIRDVYKYIMVYGWQKIDCELWMSIIRL